MVITVPIVDSDTSLGELDECVQCSKYITVGQMGKVHGHTDVDECQIVWAQVHDVGVKIRATDGLEDRVVSRKAGIIHDCTSIIVSAADCPIGGIP